MNLPCVCFVSLSSRDISTLILLQFFALQTSMMRLVQPINKLGGTCEVSDLFLQRTTKIALFCFPCFLFVLSSKLAMCLFPLEIFQHTLEKNFQQFIALQTRMLQGMFECPENCTIVRVSYRGGGAGIFHPPATIFSPEIEYGYYCGTINISYLILHVTGHTCKHVSSKCCLGSLSQITSEAI